MDRRLRREEPDFGAESEEDDDGDDDEGVGDDADGPDLLSQAGEDGSDVIKELVAERGRRDHPDDSGQPRSPRSAEEDAVHLMDGEEVDDQNFDGEDDVTEEEG